jgi:glyoxylase-like metal-dependent hydrolase (beta-lactamase superfamily II)
MATNRSPFEITPHELHNQLKVGKDLIILDVRSEDNFNNWRIEGPRPVPIQNIPYFNFVEEEHETVSRLNEFKGGQVVVVCAKGKTAQETAAILRRHGYDAKSLMGGMTEWGELYEVAPIATPELPGIVLKQFVRVGKGCLSYLIGGGGQAVVVDPARHIDQYIAEAEAAGLKITHIFDTHLHADHISGASELAEKTGATYHIAAEDAAEGQLGAEPISGTLEISLGATKVEVLAEPTPGHTPGSVSLILGDRYLFSGDTLFIESVGRPDLGGKVDEWARDLYRTLFKRLNRLRDDTMVLPAHFSGPSEIREDGIVAGSMGELRAKNPVLHVDNEEAFVSFIKESVTPQPELYNEIRKINLALLRVDEGRALELELGKNQCAVTRSGQ